MQKDMGKTFGMLKVLEEKRELVGKYSRSFYYCKCLNCNSYSWIRADAIKSGKQKSCGCLQQNTQFKTINLEGKKIGRLTVIKPTGRKGNGGHIIWKCKCECGNTIELESSLLIAEKVLSCGCLRRELSKEKGGKIGKLNVENNVILGTHLKNIANNKPLKNNTTGYKGVTFDKSRSKHIAQIVFQKKRYFLGRYVTSAEAADAYKIAKEKLHGDFLDWYNSKVKKK